MWSSSVKHVLSQPVMLLLYVLLLLCSSLLIVYSLLLPPLHSIVVDNWVKEEKPRNRSLLWLLTVAVGMEQQHNRRAHGENAPRMNWINDKRMTVYKPDFMNLYSCSYSILWLLRWFTSLTNQQDKRGRNGASSVRPITFILNVRSMVYHDNMTVTGLRLLEEEIHIKWCLVLKLPRPDLYSNSFLRKISLLRALWNIVLCNAPPSGCLSNQQSRMWLINEINENTFGLYLRYSVYCWW